MQPPSGFPRITRERIARWPRNLVYLTFAQFYIFSKKIKPLPSMTFDLWPDIQGHVKLNLRSVPFQRRKLANFGILLVLWTWKDVVRWHSWFTLTLTFPRSTEVIRGQWLLMTSYVIFRVFVPLWVIWCAVFEFGIRLSFICVDIGSLAS